ncbi:MAG: MMPL family transporter [Actinomycetales bacterium]|nr:MMPL family transporter [Actinomycetales bacterium]
MAELLYRLARLTSLTARRALLTLGAWIAVLAVAVGAFLLAGGSLASTLSIPGTETDRVTKVLENEIPGVGGAVGTVVFQTSDGSAFSDQQKSDIGDLLDSVAGMPHVSDISNPFTTEADRADRTQKLADQQTQLDDARAQLDDAQQQIDDGRAQLQQAQQQLDDARAQAQAAGAGDAVIAQLDAQQAQLDAQRQQLETNQTKLDDSRAELLANAQKLDDAERLVDASSEIRQVSKDGSTAVGAIAFDASLFDLQAETRTAVGDALHAANIDGVTIDYSSTLSASTDGLVGPGEITGVVIAALVLIIMLRALRPAMLPLISSLIGVGVGVAGAMAFSGVVDMTSVTPVLGLMLGLAVGIDYSLFIVNRHRRQLRDGVELHESIALANGTSGTAVVFAGTTVVVALIALLVTGIPFLGVMGVVGAACVAIAVLVAVTLTPALLSLFGMGVLRRRDRARIGAPEHAPAPVKPMGTLRAVVSVVVAVVALLVIAIPALSLRLGLPGGATSDPASTEYRAYHTVAQEFGPGQNGTLVVVAQFDKPIAEDDLVGIEADLADTLMAVHGVTAVAPVGTSDDHSTIAFQVVPAEGPDSEQTEQLVHDLRDLSPLASVGDAGSADLGVAGQTSGNIDISEKLLSVLPLYLAVVVGLSLLILIVVFRSILVPVIATAGFVLSFLAALGGTVAVYQWGWLGPLFGVHDTGPVLNFAPIIVVGVLFGLAMDYQLFLVSGMREAYVHGAPARTAVVAGFRNGRAVVTAAAIIMASVFGGFVFSHVDYVRPLGFGLAFGVLLDAFVVRMLLTPALLHLLGKAAWWIPRWLDRILPQVDVEGAALERTHPVLGAHPAPEGESGDAADRRAEHASV